jgi:nicotinate-nucleotide pyrophosphorylase (carboxylating)
MTRSSAAPAPPVALLVEPVVRAALAEDLGRAGDVTTDSVIPAEAGARMVLAAREPGRLAGLDYALCAFRLLDPELRVEVLRGDGCDLVAGEGIAVLSGRARALLSAERVALNLVCHLSGIATATRGIVEAVCDTPARITCTRKTTPGLRAAEKYAVRVGGGVNHRFGLDDGILIKDNHVAIAGSIRTALERARSAAGHTLVIEIEVDTLSQLEEALAVGVDAVLLDNMAPDTLREAVAMIAGGALAEASGRVTAETAPAIAATGVDLISVGWLTHSAPILDIGLDFDRSR